VTEAAEALVAKISERFESHRDERAAGLMSRYMRDQFTFLGMGAPARRRLQAEPFRETRRFDEDDLVAALDALWDRSEREYQYVGCDLVRRVVPRCTASLLPHLERWITVKPWWDTVDNLCRHGAGALLLLHPELRPEMDRWLRSDELWLIRSAILHQERWGAEMDTAWVFDACALQRAHPDFFVRKAIGWVLRTIAHESPQNAEAVREFILSYDDELAGLTKREALKRVVW
jgi:3-methyladenine DNA glycosylase AlkD